MKKRGLTKNKIWAIAMIGLGILSAKVTNEGTFLIFSLIWGIPVYFSKEELIR